MPVCDGASDWPLQTCNIILHVSAASIGYTGPALHQAVALDGNIININTGKFLKKKQKTNAHLSAAFSLLYSCLKLFRFVWSRRKENATGFHWCGGKCLIGSIWEVRRLTIGYYKVW